MSLDVALQSVAFYVLSCSTCAKANHRRKAKAQAKRERAEKVALEAENPGLYRHPSPFSTNQYWNEEIMMGPGPSKKNERGWNANSRLQISENAVPSSSYARSSTMNSEAPSSPTTLTEGSNISGEAWNSKRYQREDEALWGYDYPKPGKIIMDAVAKASSAAGRLLEGGLSIIGSTKDEAGEETSPHYYVRNPPVNDLHPPIVSTSPSNIAETRWMIQPPPTAKVMEGKERVTRSRASSKTSSRIDDSATPLGRQMIYRLVDAKIQRGESPPIVSRSESCSKASGSRQSNLSHPVTRHSLESSRSLNPPKPEKWKPPPISRRSSINIRDAEGLVLTPGHSICPETVLKKEKEKEPTATDGFQIEDPAHASISLPVSSDTKTE